MSPNDGKNVTTADPQENRARHFRRQLIRSLAHVGLTGTPFLIALSLVIGICGGVSALVFRWLIGTFSTLFLADVPAYLGSNDYLPAITAVGFVIVAILVNKFAKEAKGAGIPEVMAAVATDNGVIRPRVAFVKVIASALCIGSGGSVGREGPIVQIGSAAGSSIGQLLGFSGERLKVLVGCGAAAGIAATFNAPIAGGFFALEVILGDFSISTFSPILFSSVTANAVMRYSSANEVAFAVPDYHLNSLYELIFYFVLAILCGFTAVFFSKMLYAAEDLFEKITHSEYARACLGGLVIGGLGLYYPQILGVGYETITDILLNQLDLSLILVVKLNATTVTLGAEDPAVSLPPLFSLELPSEEHSGY
jgi:CIC family chloride channel protein